MTTSARSEDPRSLVDQVLEVTRERILSGEYPPGSRLRLQMLAERSGASLIPVREALRVLEAERLVETIPNRGARVSPISLDDMQDLYSVRIMLECATLRDARPVTEAEIDQLEGVLANLRKAVEKDQTQRIVQLHREYHFLLYGLTGSTWLPYLINLLWKHTERYQRMALGFRHDGAHDEHLAVLKALARGDNAAAAEALEDHLETTARLVVRAHAEMTETAQPSKNSKIAATEASTSSM